MKRKIIRQGHDTLTLTLPKRWCEKYSVKPGDEVNLDDNGRALVITTQNSIERSVARIDVSKLNDRALRWQLSSIHKYGYDEIEIQNFTKEQLDIINELLKDLFIGFSIVKLTKNYCIVRSISREDESEFDTILRRAFLVTMTMSESVLEMIENRQYEQMKGLVALEHTNNQLTNFCERVINKVGHKEAKKNSFYYVVAWNLEKVCDDYKYLCDYFPGKKANVNKEILALLSRANGFVRGYYDIFYNYDEKKLSELASGGKKIVSDAVKASAIVKNEADFIVLNTVLAITYKTMDFSASFVAIRGVRE